MKKEEEVVEKVELEDLESIPPKYPSKAKEVVAVRISGVYKMSGSSYVRIQANGARKWYPVASDLQENYTIKLKDFENLNNA